MEQANGITVFRTLFISLVVKSPSLSLSYCEKNDLKVEYSVLS